MNERLTQIGHFRGQRFSPRLSSPAGELEAMRHRAAIAGGGPVGLSVAPSLARFGVRSVVTEADDSVCDDSRAT